MPQVFISYSRKEQELLEKASSALQEAGVSHWDDRRIYGGQPLSPEILTAIRESQCCLFIATDESIDSEWCLSELGAFWGAGKPVVAFRASRDMKAGQLPGPIRGHRAPTELSEAVKGVQKQLEGFEAPPGYFTSPQAFGDKRWRGFYADSKERFDVMGVGLSNWRQSPGFHDRLSELDRRGCPIRIMTADATSAMIDGFVDPRGGSESGDVVRAKIAETSDFYRALTAEFENAELRTTRTSYPHFFAAINDRRALVAWYFYSINWGNGPLVECIAGSQLYNRVAREFEALWNLNPP